ncbi:hypothetical protein ACFV5M_05040, partial [Streptomyces albidoflavus]
AARHSPPPRPPRPVPSSRPRPPKTRPQRALVLFHDRFDGCGGQPLDVVADAGIARLDSDAGIDLANRYLEPLRAEISRPLRDTGDTP